MNDILEPRAIPQDQEPLLVFCNQKNLIGEIIDWRTQLPNLLPWEHAMLSINQGKFVTQTMGIFNAYREIPMEQYLVKNTQLAFVQLTNSSPDFVKAFSKSVQKRLTAPWYVTQYDYLGVFVGQALGLPWIHTPGLEYCSVDVLRHLVNSCSYLPKEDQLIINNISREISPEGLWEIVVNNPKTFLIFGSWDFNLNPIILP